MRILVAASDSAELRGFGDGFLKVVTGVGPVLAAASVALAISKEHPDAVVSVGSAGSSGSLSIGDIVSFGSVIFPDADLTAYGMERGATLLPGHRKLSSLPLDPSSSLVLATSSSFASVPAAGADASDMEGYGVAVAAFLSGIPCFAVKAITDIAGEKLPMKEYLSIMRNLVMKLPGKVEEIIGSSF